MKAYVVFAQKPTTPYAADLMEPNRATWQIHQGQKENTKTAKTHHLADKVKIPRDIIEEPATIAAHLAEPIIQNEGQIPFDSGYIPEVNFYEVKDRLSCIERHIPLACNDVVLRFIDFFTVRRRDYTRMMLERKDYYFSIFEPYLRQHNMPNELKYLSVIESGLNPNAVSRAGAVGLWQFMPITGREMGLRQSWYIDERRDPHKSTAAACRYLKRLYHLFQDWELALAAYNCGPGYVRRALKKVPDLGRQPTFWEVYPHLPRETRSYVPQFIAAMYAIEYAKEHNIYADTVIGIAEIDSIMIYNTAISLPKLAAQLNVSEDEIRFLNPELMLDVLPALQQPYYLKIPARATRYFNENSQSILAYASTHAAARPYKNAHFTPSSHTNKKIIHTVKKGEYIAAIAKQYGVSVQQIKEWNQLDAPLKVGQKLTIYTKKSSTAPKDTVTHLVEKGDTLWSIAKKYNISVEELQRINQLKDENIQPGQKLNIKI